MIFLIIGLSGLGLFLFMLKRRNTRVLEECIRVQNVVDALAKKDIARDLPWEWRYDSFESMSYDKMLYEFWKPVKSYFKNSPCCQESPEINKRKEEQRNDTASS